MPRPSGLFPLAFDRYAQTHSAGESAALRAIDRVTRASTSMPQMMVGAVEGAFLRLLVRLSGARRVLEIGTFTGYSALVMAEGLPKGGRIVTLDVDPETARLARRHWKRSPHGAKIEQRLGPALDSLKALKGPFDFVFIDADKENYVNYWEAALPKVRKGGLVAADNVLWGGRVLNPSTPEDRAIARFNERVKKDRRVEAVMLNLRDGVTLAWKK